MSSRSLDIITVREELGRVLESFEKASGLYVCVRPLSEIWRDEANSDWLVPSPYHLHRSAFCRAMKARHPRACERCDLHQLHHDCHPGMRHFVRACHAGAEEILIPLWLQGVLVGVVFAGQFRRSRKGPAKLPLRSDMQLERIYPHCLMLRAYMMDIIRRLEQRKYRVAPSRWGQVETFLRSRLSEDPSLEDLASHLALSPSRTSHLVRDVMGMSFRELKAQYRLELARDLLTATSAKLAFIAAKAGFSDVNYFCRHFKQKVGITPTEYRRMHGYNIEA